MISNMNQEEKAKRFKENKDGGKEKIVTGYIKDMKKTPSEDVRSSGWISNVNIKIWDDPEFANLNELEQSFCQKVTIFPKQFLEIKNKMIEIHESNESVEESFIK